MRSMICGNCMGRGKETVFEETERTDEVATVKMTEVKCRRCNGTGRAPMTNTDHIRSMSDEGLAMLLAESQVVLAELMLKQFGIGFTFSDENKEKIAHAAMEMLQQPWEEE